MRQYQILYRKPETDWVQLEPHIHSRIYDRPEINASIEYMKENCRVEGMAIRLEAELFNLIACDKPKLELNSFPMEAADATT